MIRHKQFINILLFTFVLFIAGLQNISVAADVVSVQAQVDKQEVAVGESFLLQIKIEGDDSPSEPDLAGLQDFTVQPRGGGQNNRESITIINGKMNRISEHGYVFRYALTPKRDGMLTIPALAITAAGKTLLSQPITIKVAKPVQTDEFILRQNLSEIQCYVGQPLVYTVVWYVNRNIEEFQFLLPVLDDQRFENVDFPEDRNYSGQDAIVINLDGSKAVVRQGKTGQHITVTLRRILIPMEPGVYSLEPASVASRVVTGYRQQRGGQPGSLFNDRFFDNMFGRRQPVSKQFLTQSPSLQLKVLPLPDENRPQDFSGLVGQYSLAAEASPTEVNVGDPITLNIMVTGAEYLDNVILPPLKNQPGMNVFKVPEEIGQGEIDGRVKIFTQTIRAKDPSITEIPAIRLDYFNPQTGAYETARSNSVPLQVNATRVVTARDAEGAMQGEGKSELTTLDKGIAYNYVGDDVLVNQHVEIISWFSSPFGLILLLFPPTVYLLILVPISIRRKRMLDADVLQAKRALSDFSREVKKLQKDMQMNGLQGTAGGLVEAIRGYLGKRLQVQASALVFTDIAERLKHQGVDAALLNDLQAILDWCEAYHYGGIDTNGSGQANLQKMLDNALILFKKIDLCFK
ncbi:BatD family protein [Thermodesulfobacteriota bacterium]